MSLSTGFHSESIPLPSAIAFFEFTQSGPTLLHQYPPQYFTDAQVMKFQNFVFPNSSLFDRTLTLLYENRKMIAHAKRIQDDKYQHRRDQYLFNVVLSFDGNLDVFPYLAIVKKIVNEFCVYEIEESFLTASKHPDVIPNLLASILSGLKTYGEVGVEISATNWLFLKLIPTHNPELNSVDSKSVPVINHDVRTISHTELDQTVAEVLSHVDEIRPLTALAKDSNISLREICVDVSRHLLYFNIVKGYVPLFRYSNAYLICPNISQLLNNFEFQEELLAYIKRDFNLHELCINEVIRLFLSMKHAQSLYQLYRLEELSQLKFLTQTLLVRRIIEFGIIHKLVVPLQEYCYVPIDSKLASLLEGGEEFLEVDRLCWQHGIPRDQAIQNLEDTTLFYK